jgi:uncharacterized membrane protein YfcA
VNPLAIGLALLMGVTLGLLGGGGSILAVPILVYVLALPSKVAIATSLLVVGLTSAFALIPHARAGNVVWKTGAIFGAFGMMGAGFGGWLAQFVPDALLLVGFALLMFGAGIAMLRKKQGGPAAPSDGASLPVIAAEGLVVGVVTGLIGAGGGFIIVPALVLMGGLDMKRAVGTSLFIIAIKSAAGFAGYLSHVQVDWALAGGFAVASVTGAFLGSLVARRVDASNLKSGFGVFVLVVASVMLTNEIEARLGMEAMWPAVVAGVVGLAVGTVMAVRQQAAAA